MRRIERRSGNTSILPTLVIICLIFFGLQTFFTNNDGFPQIFLLSLLIFFLIFFFVIFALTLFLLPLNKPTDLFEMFHRIFLFTLHLHGPIQLVRDGKPEVIHAGFKTNNPGLIWLDSASAAIISRTTSYHRVAGPGICFTQKGEFISNAISLSPQKKWVGPQEDEEPFSPQGKKESWENYQSRLKRAETTTAYTMDGKKIIASFLLEFKLDAAAGEGGCPYGFNPIAVKKAALSQAQETRDGMTGFVENWSDLPGILVADYWKEFIGHHRCEEIALNEKNVLNDFLKEIRDCISDTNSQKMNPATQLDVIRQLINQRGIELQEIHLIHVFIEDDAMQTTRFLKMQEFPSSYVETASRSNEQEKTDMTIRSQQMLGNILAGMINELSVKGNLSYAALSKKVNLYLKTLTRR